MVHCKETDFRWMHEKLRPMLNGVNQRLFVYEKCHSQQQIGQVDDMFLEVFFIDRADPSFVQRGDECSQYLTHIVYQYNQLADYTIFIHSDPGEHTHFPFMKYILQSMQLKTFNQGFMHLNGPRHVRTITPCIQQIGEVIFGYKIQEQVGPYCCQQFLVARPKIHERDQLFYERMLMMVNGSMPYDLCTTSTVQRSTHCYGMEFLWHMVWGEQADPPLRQDDPNLPTAFRLKFQTEHDKNEWNDVVLSPNVPKKIVTQQEFG